MEVLQVSVRPELPQLDSHKKPSPKAKQLERFGHANSLPCKRAKGRSRGQFQDENQKLTFAELDLRASRLAHRQERGT